MKTKYLILLFILFPLTSFAKNQASRPFAQAEHQNVLCEDQENLDELALQQIIINAEFMEARAAAAASQTPTLANAEKINK